MWANNGVTKIGKFIEKLLKQLWKLKIILYGKKARKIRNTKCNEKNAMNVKKMFLK